MKAIVYGALVMLTITAASANENEHNADYMLPRCKAAVTERFGYDMAMGAGVCLGIVTGIAYALIWNHQVMEKATEVKSIPFGCADIPLRATRGQQLTRVVVSYIEAHPNRMHEPFEVLTAYALMDAWPCKK